MKVLTSPRLRVAALCVAVTSLSACALPRPGPNKTEIFSGSVMEDGNAYVVTVNDQVTRATSELPPLGFSSSFINAGIVGSDTISPGDVLSLMIWENVDDGLLTGAGGATELATVQVDGDGFIFVPYAGRIRAAGNSPETIRRLITEKLDAQTPDPQVMVARAPGDGATVTVAGAINAQGVYPIERPTRTLTAMIANAGGVAVEPEIAQIKVIRGSHTGTIWFQDLFENPRNDIPLRNGDRLLVEADTRAFTVLGATGTQSRVQFNTRSISALEAIAQVGGLNSSLADPTGVFVLRDEREEVARAVLGRPDITGDQRLIYVLNLTDPNGLFLARDFDIRDGDTLYVTEAPFVQWSRTLSALIGTLSTVDTIDSIADGL